MIACVSIGIFTGFIFLMVLLFVAGAIDGPAGVIMSPSGPLLQIFYNATESKAGAICLLMYLTPFPNPLSTLKSYLLTIRTGSP